MADSGLEVPIPATDSRDTVAASLGLSLLPGMDPTDTTVSEHPGSHPCIWGAVKESQGFGSCPQPDAAPWCPG